MTAAPKNAVFRPAHPEIGKSEEFREIGNAVEGRPRSGTLSAPLSFRKSGEQILAGRSATHRMTAARKNAGRAHVRPKPRRGGGPAQRSATHLDVIRVQERGISTPATRGNREIGEMPKNRQLSRRAAAPKNAVFLPAHPKYGKQRLAEKSESQSKNGRAQDRGVRPIASAS